jgi:CDP-paratose 2-epimerase
MNHRDTVLVTGSAGLIGSEATRFFSAQGYKVVGIDNDMRSRFFGREASTEWNRRRLERDFATYRHVSADIRDRDAMDTLFREIAPGLALIIHTAAQPSHDWAAGDPHTDFSINATGTLVLLELTRRLCPEAPFIFTSTNKVYGDTPNRLPLVEAESRWEIDAGHSFFAHGIDESMSVDASMHSLFGVSKTAADLLVQEYGRYFGLNTACFRGGCLTGPSHSGTALHGFLAYLMKCAATGAAYSVFGYAGKQVRDNIHSEDLVAAVWQFFQNPRPAQVYNIGGGRDCNCSMLEAIAICESITGRRMNWTYKDENRAGDHMWWISDTRRFRSHYPNWTITRNVPQILEEIYAANRLRWLEAG